VPFDAGAAVDKRAGHPQADIDPEHDPAVPGSRQRRRRQHAAQPPWLVEAALFFEDFLTR
jgi:hypothetical protein